MKKSFSNQLSFIAAIVIIARFGVWRHFEGHQPHYIDASSSYTKNSANTDKSTDQLLKKIFENRENKIQIQGSGVVIKTLPDDNKGSRHQRFILKTSSGQTLLIAHNIDLAPKLKGLKKGDTVAFNGEYVWTQQGGIVHWTHHDPNGNHPDGWLLFDNQKYQ